MGQTRYKQTMREGRAGDPADGGACDVITLINDDPNTAQVSTITADSASNSTKYTVTLNSVDIGFTSDASATTTEIATGIAAAINAEALVRGAVSATSSAAVVTVTSLIAGRSFTLTSSEADLTVATSTANDTADAVPFGALVLADPANDDYGRIAKTANLLARVRTITVGGTAENDKTFGVTVTLGGVAYSVPVLTAPSATLTNIASGIAAAINAMMPADTIIAASSSGVVTLTAEAPGLGFEVAVAEGKPVSMTFTVGGDSFVAFDSLESALAGIARHEQRHEIGKDGVGHYPGGSTMSIVQAGRMIVTTAESVSRGKPVFVSMADGKTFRASAATDYVELPRDRFKWAGSRSSTLGILQLSV